MKITLNHVEWRRFHDPILTSIRSNVAEVHCADEAAEFIGICHARPATGLKLKAAGSHWSLSESTDSDDSALETHFVDAVLAFEAAQEESAMQFTVGYVSLRYVGGSRALIAPAQFSETVAIEISGIRDAAGSVPFIMNAVKLARNPILAGCFHWGQFNPLTRAEVEKLSVRRLPYAFLVGGTRCAS